MNMNFTGKLLCCKINSSQSKFVTGCMQFNKFGMIVTLSLVISTNSIADTVGENNQKVITKLQLLNAADLNIKLDANFADFSQPARDSIQPKKGKQSKGSVAFQASTLRGLASMYGIQIYIPDQEKILHGDRAQPQEFPWQVAILNKQLGTLVCGGSYIGGAGY